MITYAKISRFNLMLQICLIQSEKASQEQFILGRSMDTRDPSLSSPLIAQTVF